MGAREAAGARPVFSLDSGETGVKESPPASGSAGAGAVVNSAHGGVDRVARGSYAGCRA